MQPCHSRMTSLTILYHVTQFLRSIGMKMVMQDYQCSIRLLAAMQCILGAVGSFNHGLNTTLHFPYRSQLMSEYLFSRVIPRAELGWSQVERFARLDSYDQHQAVWQLFDLPPATGRTAPAFLFRHEWHGDLPAFYILSHSTPQDRAGLWSIQSKPYAPALLRCRGIDILIPEYFGGRDMCSLRAPFAFWPGLLRPARTFAICFEADLLGQLL